MPIEEETTGNDLQFFDMTEEDQDIFLQLWATNCAIEMTPKLNDSTLGDGLTEYIQIQNDTFDEVMESLGATDSSGSGRLARVMSGNELYTKISSEIWHKVMEKSEAEAEKVLDLLAAGRIQSDLIDPNKMLTQLRNHADRGNLLINLPGTVWLSAYLFYFNPSGIGNYVGVGKYPPGHVSIVLQSKSSINNRDATISSQVGKGNGVMRENIDVFWNCKARLCYLKEVRWVWAGWRSFDRERYKIYRLEARWMPTIAPADVLLSDKVVTKLKID